MTSPFFFCKPPLDAPVGVSAKFQAFILVFASSKSATNFAVRADEPAGPLVFCWDAFLCGTTFFAARRSRRILLARTCPDTKPSGTANFNRLTRCVINCSGNKGKSRPVRLPVARHGLLRTRLALVMRLGTLSSRR
ncbi:MAG: hypothetical protein H6661_07385 [Ardenticatenaceae bacterium]|nr:hypothetical protein [Ardenticatenaceae bacterium]